MVKSKLVKICLPIFLLLVIVAIFILKLNTPQKDLITGKEINVTFEEVEWEEDTEEVQEHSLYYVRQMNKADFADISAHEYIEKINSVLKPHKDSYWVAILFEDGTGIKYPGADIKETAFYGEMDKNGNITKEIGRILVAGTQVTYGETLSSISTDSVSLSMSLPEKYINDSTFVNIDGTTIYVSVVIAESENPNETAMELVNIINQNYSGDISEIKIMLNELKCFSWTQAGGLTEEEWSPVFIKGY